MKKAFIALALTFVSVSAQAASTNFDLKCFVIKINRDQYNAPPKVQEDNLFRLQLVNGEGKISWANAPMIGRSTDAQKLVKWQELVPAGPVKVANKRWNVKVEFPSQALLSLDSSSKRNDDPNPMFSGEMELAQPLTLPSGEEVRVVQFGFCFGNDVP